MSEEHDGLDAPFEQAFQHGMTLAGQLGIELSRAWQKHRDRQAAAEGAQAALMQAQFTAERTTALQALKATSNPQWWETASRDEVAKAFELSTAWKDHAPEAAIADQRIRQEVTSRYGIDGEQLARSIQGTAAASPALTDKQQLTRDLQEAKAHFVQADPERLSAYEKEVQYSDSAKDDIRHQKALVADWRTATGPGPRNRPWEAIERRKEQLQQAEQWLYTTDPQRASELHLLQLGFDEHGNPDFRLKGVQDKVLQDWKEAMALKVLAEQIDADAARDQSEGNEHETVATTDYARAGRDKETAITVESQDLSTTENTPAPQMVKAPGHEQVAATAGNTGGAKWDSAERREALANDLRTKAVPDEAITARMHAERQHARPISASTKAQAPTAKKTKTGTGQKQTHTLRKHL